MTNAITNETPAKVFSLLGVAIFSLAFLFGVSTSDASLSKVYNPLPDVFSPENVVSVIDNVAASYSQFLSANFIQPLMADYKVYADNLAWIGQESKIAYYLGVDNLGQGQEQGKVAGANTVKPEVYKSNLNMGEFFSVLIR